MKVLVLGLGQIGCLVAELLSESHDVTGVSSDPTEYGGKVVYESITDPVHDKSQSELRTDPSRSILKPLLESHDAVVSCLPWHINWYVAKMASECNCNYFDFTEDMQTTKRIEDLAHILPRNSITMAPQLGLAPGLVSQIAKDQIDQFDTALETKIRVGALPQHPTGELGYSFNWSPAGVINEYIKDGIAVVDDHLETRHSLEHLEKLIVDGVTLEAFSTSGGLGSLPSQGLVPNLDYKTMRYPGHCRFMKFLINEIGGSTRDLEDKLSKACPPNDEDSVFIHVSTKGLIAGKRKEIIYARRFTPKKIYGKMRTAIAWTTAVPAVNAINYMLNTNADSAFRRIEDCPYVPLENCEENKPLNEEGLSNV